MRAALKGILLRIIHNIRFLKRKTRIKTRRLSGMVDVGKNVTIGRKTIIGRNCKIGDYSYTNTEFGETVIGDDTEIGKYCSIAPNVIIGLGEHNTTFISTHPFLYNKKYGFCRKNDNIRVNKNNKKTIIGNDVWIGANAMVKKGVVIGTGAVVGMNSVVTKDIPPYAICAGNPATIKRYRFDRRNIERLLKTQWWEYESKYIKCNLAKFYDINKAIGEKTNERGKEYDDA